VIGYQLIMAVKKKRKKVTKIKFELTRSGIAGIAIVCFCLFIWMFLLGVWSAQSVLQSKFMKIGGPEKHPVTFLKDSKKRKPEK